MCDPGSWAQPHGLWQRGRRHLRRDDRRRRGRGGRADGRADPQARRRSRPADADFIIILVGGLSSIATDAGYLILIPLGAAAFLSVGRHPLAGLAAAYAGVSAAFAVNVLITPLDGLLTEITNEAIASPTRRVDRPHRQPCFDIVSTIFVALVITFITERMIEPRLGTLRAGDVAERRPRTRSPAGESRGPAVRRCRRCSLRSAVIVLLTVLPARRCATRRPARSSATRRSWTA